MPGWQQAARVLVGLNPSNDLEALVAKKLEEMGQDFLLGWASGESSTVNRIQQAIATGGMSELTRVGDSALRNLTPAGWNKVARAIGQGGQSNTRKGAWSYTDWATSREDWLDNRWRHDWRSQPRDMRGRWIPGRLQYIEELMQYRGTRRRRKLKKFRARRTSKRTRRRFFAKDTDNGG